MHAICITAQARTLAILDSTAQLVNLGSFCTDARSSEVTVAVVISGRGKCSVTDGLAYIGSQFVGGACAGLLYGCMDFDGYL